MGLNILYEGIYNGKFNVRVERIEDYDKGIFAYTFKCILSKNGYKITEGVGSCNSKENKYRWRWAKEDLSLGIDKEGLKQRTNRWGKTEYQIENDKIYSQTNTILKMAKKRAQIDATLTVASLSELFTQDMEDMGGVVQQEEVSNLTDIEAQNLKITFGKFKGKTLKEIYEIQPSYLEWLKDSAKEEVMKKAAPMVLESNDKVNKPKEEHKAENTEQTTIDESIFEGLDYFSLDTDIDQDDKVAIIEAQHGMLGFGVVIKLLMKIYSEGYYYDWTEKEQILFSKRVNANINLQSKVEESKVNKNSSNNTTAAETKIENPVAPVDADSIKQDAEPVTDMDADSIQQDDTEKRKKDLQRIQNYYKRQIRRRNICSSRDLSDIVFVYETYFIADLYQKTSERKSKSK